MKSSQEGSLSRESVPASTQTLVFWGLGIPGITAAVSFSATLAFPLHFPFFGAKKYPVRHSVPDSRVRGVYFPGNVFTGLHLACAVLCVRIGGRIGGLYYI